MLNQLDFAWRQLERARENRAVVADALDVLRRDAILVFGDDRQALDGVEMREVLQPLRFRHLLERGAQARGALPDQLFEMRLLTLQRILRVLELQQRRGANPELGLLDGLGDEIVGAGLDRRQPIVAAGHRGQHDDGNVGANRVVAKPAAHLEAVQAGHHQIEQHEVDAEMNLGEAFDAVGGRLDVEPGTRGPAARVTTRVASSSSTTRTRRGFLGARSSASLAPLGPAAR